MFQQAPQPAVVPQPYPHLILDDIFTEGFLASMTAHWPTAEQFVAGHETVENGKHRIDLSARTLGGGPLTGEQKAFWVDFSRTAGRRLAKRVLGAFARELLAVYGPSLSEARVGALSFLEALNGHVLQHPPHVHQVHTPSLLATILIYLEDGNSRRRGTSVSGLPAGDLDMLARLALEHPTWKPGEASPLSSTVVPFVRNRVFAFLESPIAWHGVESFDEPDPGPRRMLRYFVRIGEAQAPALLTALYGTPRPRERLEPDGPEFRRAGRGIRCFLERMAHAAPSSAATAFAAELSITGDAL